MKLKLLDLFSPDEIRQIKFNVNQIESNLNNIIKKVESRDGSFDDI